MSERETIMDLIRNEYDPAPRHYRMGDNWDDGAGRIADAILADKTLLLRKHAGEIELLKGALRSAVIEECAKVLDDCAQDWHRIRDPGMANNAKSYASKIRALANDGGGK